MNDLYRQLLIAARGGDEGQIRSLLHTAMQQGGPTLPVEHFAVGFALGVLHALEG